jgi:hypothetical protein
MNSPALDPAARPVSPWDAEASGYGARMAEEVVGQGGELGVGRGPRPGRRRRVPVTTPVS